MTKLELAEKLKEGAALNSLFAFRPGQECEIFKSNRFQQDEIIYIPDIWLNEIPVERPIADPEEINDILNQCYTGNDFIDECDGDVELAERLFWFCDWQHPSTVMCEGFGDDD